jgi:hypothetical protein
MILTMAEEIVMITIHRPNFNTHRSLFLPIRDNTKRLEVPKCKHTTWFRTWMVVLRSYVTTLPIWPFSKVRDLNALLHN